MFPSDFPPGTPDLADAPALNGRFLADYRASLAELGPTGGAASRVLLQAHRAHPAEGALPELILGENSLLPFHFLRVGDRLGRAVVKIRRGDGACGTGFLVAPDILLTNHHVLPDAETAAQASAVADYESDPPEGYGELPRPIVEAALAPERLFVTEAGLDFAFCGVTGLESLGTIPLDRSDPGLGPCDVVNIIQHPRGRPKEVAIRDNQVVRADGVVLHYVCDTEPGSSGSPVFDSRWRLVALHHASIAATDANGGRPSPGASPEARFLNEGIRMGAVARWLDSDAAGGAELDPLRRLFRGLDPSSGFFGALGRRPSGGSAAEFVAAAESGPIAGAGAALDVGFWDLRALRRSPFSHVDAIGAILAEMALDVWVLAHASAAQARALAEQLDMIFRREHSVVAAGSSVAVIGRATRFLMAEPVEAAPEPVVRVRLNLGGLAARWAALDLVPLCGAPCPSARERIAALGDEAGDALLIGGRAALLGDADREALPSLGRDLHEARGRNCGLVLLRGRDSRIDRLFATPGLEPRGDRVRIVTDRQVPESAARISGRAPIAARVVFEG